MSEITLPLAIEKLKEELSQSQAFNSYYDTWKSNIAMSFFDAVRNGADNSGSASAPYYQIDKDSLHKICNDGAKSFLFLLMRDFYEEGRK